MVRNDSRSDSSVAIAIVSITIVVHGGLLAIFLNQDRITEDWIWVTVPMVPLLVLGYQLQTGLAGTTRSFYLRGLERAVQARLGSDLPLSSLPSAGPDLSTVTIPSYVHLMHTISSTRNSPPEILALLAGGTILTVGTIVVEVVFCLTHVKSQAVLTAGIVAHGFLLLVALWLIFMESIGGPRLWRRVLAGLPNALSRPLGYHDVVSTRKNASPGASPPTGWPNETSFPRYLFGPRPLAQLLTKSVVIWVVAVTLGAASTHRYVGWWVGDVAILALMWELVVYPGRYYINDLMGASRDVDDHYWLISGKARLSTTGKRFATVLALMARWGFGLWLVARLTPFGDEMLRAMLIVGIVTLAYEGCRAGAGILGIRRLLTVGVWVLVGAGYAARAVLGVAAGYGPGVPVETLVGTAAFMSAVGSYSIVLYWLLECLGNIPQAVPLPAEQYHAGLRHKPHVVILGQAAGLLSTSAQPTQTSPPYRIDEPIADRVRTTRGPWSWFVVAAAIFSALAGLRLGAAHHTYSIPALAFVVIGAIAGGLLVSRRLLRSGWMSLYWSVAAVSCIFGVVQPGFWSLLRAAACYALVPVSFSLLRSLRLIHWRPELRFEGTQPPNARRRRR